MSATPDRRLALPRLYRRPGYRRWLNGERQRLLDSGFGAVDSRSQLPPAARAMLERNAAA